MTMWGVNHLSMSRMDLKFIIYSEILVGSNVGGQLSFNVQAKSLI